MMELFKDDRLRKDRWLFVANIAGMLFNLAWAMMFSDGYFAWANWLAAGFCGATALCQISMAKMRALIEDQTNTLVAQGTAMSAMSPAHMRTMLQGALLQVVEQMRKDGSLPPELNVVLDDGNKPKILH